MHRHKALRIAAIGLLSLIGTGSAIADSASVAGGAAAAQSGPVMYPPLSNWMVPQTLGGPMGFMSTNPAFRSMTGEHSKVALDMSTFVPITPCRLVDTRGLFTPVYAGGPFSANQVRNYMASGNCGVPAGANRVKAVSLAVTTPPTSASGDIEVIASGATLGHTVVMVIQAGQWNSATTISAVDTTGSFQVQLRSTPGDVVIDINGYYADTSVAQTGDYYQINGNYTGGGGLLYITTSAGTAGGAVNATNSGSGVFLAYGTDAVDVYNGQIRVQGAGANTSNKPVFVAVADTSAGGNTCTVGGYPRLVLDQVTLNGNPNAIAIVGSSVANYGGAGVTDDWDPVELEYLTISIPCGGLDLQNHWHLVKTNGAPGFKNGHGYPVLVIKP
jgi:hypothetical protein